MKFLLSRIIRALQRHLKTGKPRQESVAESLPANPPPCAIDPGAMIVHGYLDGEYAFRPKQQCSKCGAFTLVAKIQTVSDSTEFSCLTCHTAHSEQDIPA